MLRKIRSMRAVGFLSALLISLSSGLFRTDQSQSSFFNIRDHHRLLNHVIATLQTSDILSCAHACLLNAKCLSVNFENGGNQDENLCEINDATVSLGSEDFALIKTTGFMFAVVVNLKLQTFTFTSLGAKGPSGPPSVDGYKGTTLDGEVVLKNGIQHWVVPRTGSYTIEAFGASGGNGTCLGCPGLKRGGLGARIKGEFWLTEGNVLLILVGQQGFWVDSFPDRPGGGGGGTFVTLASALTPLVVAGGGGGAGIDSPGYTDGDPGQTTTQGSRHGGNHGLGGSVRNTTPLKTILGGSGAGFYGNGTSFYPDNEALAFQHGGKGGWENGGFGGGGSAMAHPGGGGGYSGGGIEGSETTGSAGGGGSFNSGSAQESEADVNEGDGKVIITMLS